MQAGLHKEELRWDRLHVMRTGRSSLVAKDAAFASAALRQEELNSEVTVIHDPRIARTTPSSKPAILHDCPSRHSILVYSL